MEILPLRVMLWSVLVGHMQCTGLRHSCLPLVHNARRCAHFWTWLGHYWRSQFPQNCKCLQFGDIATCLHIFQVFNQLTHWAENSFDKGMQSLCVGYLQSHLYPISVDLWHLPSYIVRILHITLLHRTPKTANANGHKHMHKVYYCAKPCVILTFLFVYIIEWYVTREEDIALIKCLHFDLWLNFLYISLEHKQVSLNINKWK